MFENEKLEFKSQLPSNRRLAIEMIAMANSKGGRIVIGYDEKSQTVLGVDPSQKLEEKVVNIASDLIEPRLNFFASFESVDDGKVLLLIDVEAGAAKPYALKGYALEKGVFVRVGSTSRLVDREGLGRLLREGRNISFDGEPLRIAQPLDEKLLASYFKKKKSRLGPLLSHGAEATHTSAVIAQEDLQDLNLMSSDGKPTIAGALLFLEHPQSVPELSGAYIKAARFKGTQKGVIIDQMQIEGPLSEQIEICSKFVLRNIPLSGVVVGSLPMR